MRVTPLFFEGDPNPVSRADPVPIRLVGHRLVAHRLRQELHNAPRVPSDRIELATSSRSEATTCA
jgi:hypothetical protein